MKSDFKSQQIEGKIFKYFVDRESTAYLRCMHYKIGSNGHE